MTIALTGFNSDTLTFSVCADKQVAWQNLLIGTFDYELDTNYPNASCIDPITLIPIETLVWGTSTFNTSAISVTAISDTSSTILCAYDVTNPTISSLYTFNPYYLNLQQTRLSDNSVNVTVMYQQVSTGNTIPLNANTEVSWFTTPYTTDLTAVSSTNQNFIQNINGIALNVSSLLLSSDGIDYKSFVLAISSPNSYTITQDNIIINGPITVDVLEASTQYIELSALQYNLHLNEDKQLIWNIIPYTGVETISSNGIGDLTFNTQYSAISAEWITLSTTDLTQSYVYTLSSYTGVVSGIFRPYLDFTTNTTLSTTITTIVDNIPEHKYNLNVHGTTSGIAYNLPLNTVLMWKNITNDAGVDAEKVNTNIYNFNTLDTVNNIETINVYITPNTTTTYPRLCTYGFMVSALSGSNPSDAMAYQAFDIQIQEWLDSSIFSPAFTIQYEPSSLNTIYRPLTSAIYKIKNNSILPPSSVGNLIYTFNDASSTIPYNNITDVSPIEIYHTFDSLTPCVCTINLTVQTSCANYSDYVTREAIEKKIVFAEFPVAEGFILYPEFTWTGTEWGTVVDSDGTILSANEGLSAYSFCHTENFFVSSNVTTATEYVWSVQDSTDNSIQTITTTLAPTGFLPVKSPAGTTTHSVCAALFTVDLPSTMPAFYHDTSAAQRYPNFSTTFDAPTSEHRKHIEFYGINAVGLTPVILDTKVIPMGSPSNLYLTGGYTYDNGVVNNTPFNFYMGAFSFLLSSNYFSVEKTASLLGSTADTYVYINVDDVGDSYLSLPKYDINNIDIIPIIGVTPELKTPHPSAASTTWCFRNTPISSYQNKETVTVYPVLPLIYTPNRYVLTGTDVKFENLVNCFSGVENFIWTDRSNDYVTNTCSTYTTSYDTQGAYNMTLQTHFSASNGIVELSNDFENIVNVEANYSDYNPNINRVYGVTHLQLPHDYEDISIGSNDFLVADTFNASMTKLYENLEYLQYMAQLYDVPPTEYFGWLGTRYYSNSSKHFRWYVNSPNITYGYDKPDVAIDDILTTLKDVYVKNNIMYVSKGTSVSVLSSDFRATVLGTIDHKTIGDNFTNIKSIKMDSDGRLYFLDTIDENNTLNGSKNRIIVFNYDLNTNTWSLLHSWGGLGGANARTKFNNPNDMYIDSLNNVWVADTGNRVVKQYTRTGSWLQTIASEVFTNDPPMSVVLDSDRNVYILTSKSIHKFTNSGEFISTDTLVKSGAKTIRPCSDTGFAYICYSDSVVKYMYIDGTEASFANGEFVGYVENYQNTFHDEYRNLYVVGTNHILKYIDKLSIVTLKQDTDGKLWDLDSVFVDKNEYIQDWVVNRSLNRFWDNLEMVRKSLLGKFTYRTIETSTTVTVLSTLAVPDPVTFDYCNYDYFYTNGKYVTTDVIYSYQKPDVRTFTTEEYKTLPHTKDQIYIGINEFVSAPVLNRPLKKLYDNQLVLLEMLE